MSLTITVRWKDVYGNRLCYPVCDVAKRFADLVNRKTLTDRDLLGIIGLGYSVKVEGESV